MISSNCAVCSGKGIPHVLMANSPSHALSAFRSPEGPESRRVTPATGTRTNTSLLRRIQRTRRHGLAQEREPVSRASRHEGQLTFCMGAPQHNLAVGEVFPHFPHLY